MVENFELQCIEREMAPDWIDVDDLSKVILEGPLWKLYFLDTSIFIREGTFCARYNDPETGEEIVEPDWDVTWFYRDKDCPEEHMYYEQDPIDTAVHNFLNLFGGKRDEAS